MCVFSPGFQASDTTLLAVTCDFGRHHIVWGSFLCVYFSGSQVSGTALLAMTCDLCLIGTILSVVVRTLLGTFALLLNNLSL